MRATTEELHALLEKIREREERREREATKRAGLIAAAVYNTMRTKKSDKVWSWRDFVDEPVRELTPAQMESMLDALFRPTRTTHEA